MYDMYLLYMYVHILSYTEYIQDIKSVSHLKPILLDLCCDTCSTELAILTQDRSIQSFPGQGMSKFSAGGRGLSSSFPVGKPIYIL